MDVTEAHIRSYRRALQILRRSPATIVNYEITLRQLAAHAKTDLEAITRAQVEEFLLDSVEQDASATAARKHRNLRAFYNWMVKEEIVDRSPVAGVGAPTVTETPVPVVPDDVLAKLLKACAGSDFPERRDTAIIRLWCEAGSPRVSEMVGLTTDTVDMQHDQVTLHGKGDKVRTIPFGAKTGQALDRYIRIRAKHKDAKLPNLWLGVKTGRGGLTATGAYRLLERRCEQAGIPRIHPHQLRHTAAHIWKDRGGSDGDAMALFGWSSAEMPRRYGKSAEVARAQRAARRVSQADRL
ncbi:tyrosine-type recombinase/integrase [Polymorphospora rubra]|uniref:tyrosine-type recombinase/integrase n=1 Tax=Polymorphospora rubra TaxID=338584 RepID=UPI003405FE1D